MFSFSRFPAIFSKKRALSWLLLCVSLVFVVQAPVSAADVCSQNGVTKFVQNEFAKLDMQYQKLLFSNQEAAKAPSEAVPNLVNDYRVYRCKAQSIASKAYVMLKLNGIAGKSYVIQPFGCPKESFLIPASCKSDELSGQIMEFSAIQKFTDDQIAKTKKVLLLSQKVSADRQEGSFISARLWALNAKLPLLLNDLMTTQTEFGRLFTNIGSTIPQCATGGQ